MANNITLNNIKSRQSELYNLVMAALDWLNYINRVSVGDILEEASLKYPITEYLERKEKKICELEVNHPVFKRRRIDIAWRDVLLEKTNEVKWDCFIEVKYAKNIDAQNVFDDLCRLYYTRKKYPESKCYFIIFGERDYFVNNLQSNIIHKYTPVNNEFGVPNTKEIEDRRRNAHPFAKWFTLQMSNPLKTIKYTNNNTYYRNFLTRKNGAYIFRDAKDKLVEITLTTKLLERRSTTNSPGEFCIAAWEVLETLK